MLQTFPDTKQDYNKSVLSLKFPKILQPIKFQITTLKFLRGGSNFAFPFPDLLRQQILMDVGHNTAVCDRDSSQKLAQLLVVPHSQLNVPRDNSVLLVVSGCISSKLKHL